MLLTAKTPVSTAPSVPPTPCTPNASSESSYPSMCLSVVAAKKQTMPPVKPITIADIGETNPAAGVITTKPATAPEIAPRTVGLPDLIHSMNIHPSVAAAAAKCVAISALLAKAPALSAEPALKPNQPTHSRAAPMTEMTTLCGGIAVVPKPLRLPSTIAATSAVTPELMCTTVPPAKSIALILPPFHALSSPPLAHTMCASGQ